VVRPCQAWVFPLSLILGPARAIGGPQELAVWELVRIRLRPKNHTVQTICTIWGIQMRTLSGGTCTADGNLGLGTCFLLAADGVDGGP